MATLTIAQAPARAPSTRNRKQEVMSTSEGDDEEDADDSDGSDSDGSDGSDDDNSDDDSDSDSDEDSDEDDEDNSGGKPMLCNWSMS